MIGVIAGRELRSLFLSPLAWTILGVVQFLLAYLFLWNLEMFSQYQPRFQGMEGAPGVTAIVVASLFGTASLILLLVTPLMTMRVLSEERRTGTLTLLRTAPVSTTEIVLGKYLALLGFFGIMIGLATLMPLSLYLGTRLDAGQLASCVLATFLLLAAFGAAGLFISSLTSHPTVAAVGTFGVLLIFWIVDRAGSTGDQGPGEVLGYLSLMRHFQPMLKGVFNSSDVVYYVLFSVLFLTLTVWRLDSDRLAR